MLKVMKSFDKNKSSSTHFKSAFNLLLIKQTIKILSLA